MAAVKLELSSKSERTLDCMFLAIVDIVELQTYLIVVGERERSLATSAGFDSAAPSAEVAALLGESAKSVLVLAAGQVSRKADFIPPLSVAVEAGWSAAQFKRSESELSLEKMAEDTEIAVLFSETAPSKGKHVRRRSKDIESFPSATPAEVPQVPSTIEVVAVP